MNGINLPNCFGASITVQRVFVAFTDELQRSLIVSFYGFVATAILTGSRSIVNRFPLLKARIGNGMRMGCVPTFAEFCGKNEKKAILNSE